MQSSECHLTKLHVIKCHLRKVTQPLRLVQTCWESAETVAVRCSKNRKIFLRHISRHIHEGDGGESGLAEEAEQAEGRREEEEGLAEELRRHLRHGGIL